MNFDDDKKMIKAVFTIKPHFPDKQQNNMFYSSIYGPLKGILTHSLIIVLQWSVKPFYVFRSKFFIVMSLEWPETLGCLYPSKRHCETFFPLFIQACARPTYLNFHKICTEPPFWQIYWGHFLGSILLHHWCCAVHNVHPPTLTAAQCQWLHRCSA